MHVAFRKRRKGASARGFLLLELIVAISVIGFGLMSVLLVIQSASLNVRCLEQRFIATEAARSALALIRANPSRKHGSGQLDLPSACFRGLTDARCTYSVRERDPKRSGLRVVAVTVTWSMGPTTHKSELCTFLRGEGP